MIDVSVVLNIHKGYEFLAPTLTSLRDSIIFAQERGLNVELLAVFDCSDERTIHNFNNFDFEEVSNISVIKTKSNSLSTARNLGIKNSSGIYIFTADEDDLISRNSIYQLYQTATKEKSSREYCYFQNYLVAFGEDYYVAEFLDSENLNAVDFIANNVYTSRIFARRDLLIKFKYREIETGSGFAFEDWDLINRLYAEGVEFKVAKNTVLFYRIRKNSMLSNSNLIGTDLVPRSKLHKASYLINRVKFNVEGLNPQILSDLMLTKNLPSEMFDNSELLNYLFEAIEIEPTILYNNVLESKNYSPVAVSYTHWAYAYLTSIKQIFDFDFSDVVIFPFLNPGGGEKYVLQILRSIEKIDQNARFLVLTIETTERNSWRSQLNEKYEFLDLRNSFPYLTDENFEKLLINLLMAVEKEKPRLHLKTSYFGENFILKYQRLLAEKYSILYYRFSDSVYQINGREFKRHNITSFLRNSLYFLDHVLTDNKKIIENDRNQHGDFYMNRYSMVETYIENSIRNWDRQQPNFRLLWASRISWEKRPQLLPLIMRKLKEKIPMAEIEIFGESSLPDFLSIIDQTEGLTYKGGFDGFETLPVNDYDMMIYTSKYDGSPNILIEAMTSGIPIVAPDVGGIKELFPVGYDLILNQVDDNEITEEYVRRILLNYENWNDVLTEASHVKNLARSRFSISRHIKDVEHLLFRKIHDVV